MLVGNYSVLNKTPGRWLGGTSAAHAAGVGSAQVHLRGNWGKPGAMRNFAFQDGATVALPLSSRPDGYGGTGWLMPITEGAMSAHNLLLGDGEASAGNLAGGKNAEAALSGAGDMQALGILIVSAAAALAGSGTITQATLESLLPLTAAIGGSGTTAATLNALGILVSVLDGDGELTATIRADGELAAAIVLEGATLTTSNVGDAVWNSLLEAGFTASQIVRIIAAATAGASSGGPGSPVFRNLGDTQDQVSGTADADGNRSAVAYGD